MSEAGQSDLTILTVQLLSAYVANNSLASEDLAGLIRSTRAALEAGTTPAAPEIPTYVPAVSVRKSLASQDHILSLIDGRPYKMLKRHLASNGMTPAEYRDRYNLPNDYPMVAPTYSQQRRETATRIGLGSISTRNYPSRTDVKAKAEITAHDPASAPPVKAVRAKATRRRADNDILKAVSPEAATEVPVKAARRGRPAKAASVVSRAGDEDAQTTKVVSKISKPPKGVKSNIPVENSATKAQPGAAIKSAPKSGRAKAAAQPTGRATLKIATSREKI